MSSIKLDDCHSQSRSENSQNGIHHKLCKSKEDKWDVNDSSSLTAISDDEDCKSALTSRPASITAESCDADMTLIDEVILDTVRTKTERNLLQLPKAEDGKCTFSCFVRPSLNLPDKQFFLLQLMNL